MRPQCEDGLNGTGRGGGGGAVYVLHTLCCMPLYTSVFCGWQTSAATFLFTLLFPLDVGHLQRIKVMAA